MGPYAKQAPPSRGDHNATASALAKLVSEIKQSANVASLLHPAIEALSAYDHENQSDFLHTLDVYLENDCNAQKCGRLLFLHRNSLVYRIHRIQEIANIDLTDPAERSYLRLSLLLK